ncbi:RraA family protein [Novosphingobium flavum]|uniref:Putative 4-hydroxy-4-methyl-2-oxoglutarate aldolase n=1 Tax=Novosphingobium flavum TaxID=1778672 RepID=A0A7X1FUA5_9SPHN|nr:RraA family protein [Novosphingobium flavum]MBC2667135.1 RraA family protein [Novosphingobium flavum]
MAYYVKRCEFRKLAPERIEAWKKIATATASDCMNRSNGMSGRIRPIRLGMKICGQARTVQSIYADNSMIHYANSTANPGEVVVADAGGVTDVAMFGGVTALEGIRRGLGGFVIDGAVRDIAEAMALDYPVFSAAITPKGPHKAFGGAMDIPIACGGVSVKPGDLILGDDDGLVVVPLEREEEIFAKALDHRKKEDYWLTVFDGPDPLYKVLGIPDPEFMD